MGDGLKTLTCTNSGASFVEFDGLTEYMDHVGTLAYNKHDAWYTPEDVRPDWRYGFYKDEQTTYQAIRYGRARDEIRDMYFDMIGKFEPMLEKFEGIGKSCKRRRVTRDEGDEVNIDRYLDGNDACWDRVQRDAKMRMVRFGINFAMSWQNQEENFLKLAAIGAAVCDIVSRLGFGTEISLVCSTTSLGERTKGEFGVKIPVKREDDQIDFESILMCSVPGLLRNTYFRVCDHYTGHYNSMCYDPSTQMKQLMGVDYMLTLSWTDEDQQKLNIEGMLSDLAGQVVTSGAGIKI